MMMPRLREPGDDDEVLRDDQDVDPAAVRPSSSLTGMSDPPNLPPAIESPDAWELCRSTDETRARKVAVEYERERARREARRRLDAEERGTAPFPEITTLTERLARPESDVAFRIEAMQPVGSRVIAAAQFKAGKTTLVDNLTRSLVDGDPFLGRFAVTPVEGCVARFDFEMSPRQMDSWLRDQRVRHAERVLVIQLRGIASSFDILNADVRARWAGRLRQHGVDYLVLDCLRPVLDALGLDEHRDTGRFLVALDALMAEARVAEGLVVHHMGHVAERSRGDSRLRDWPDVEWRLVRQSDDPASARYLSAYGRDVDMPESELSFDARTRRLTLAGGSRKDAEARTVLPHVIALLAEEPGLSNRGIEKALTDGGDSRDQVRAAVRLGIRTGAIVTRSGPRRATLHYVSAPVSGSARAVSGDTASDCADPYMGPLTRALTSSPPAEEAGTTNPDVLAFRVAP